MATATVKHNYTYAYNGNGGNAYTITWYDNGTAVCSGQYSIIADSMEQLTLSITLNALALRESNAKLFKENDTNTELNGGLM